jgi:hypothetical protein
LVAAFDRDLRSEERLGECPIDAAGRYEIAYTRSQFVRGDKKAADLVIRAFGSDGKQLIESKTIFNAPEAATVDLLIPARPGPVRPSEHERLLSDLQPVLENVRPAELNEDDLDFLVGETGFDRERLEALRAAGMLEEKTTISAQTFYALGRARFPLALDQLCLVDFEAIECAVVAASEQGVVDASARGSVEALLALLRVRRDSGLSADSWHELTVRVLDDRTGEPLAGAAVRVRDHRSDSEAIYIADDEGNVSFPSRTAPGDETDVLNLELVVRGDDEVHAAHLRANGGVIEARLRDPVTADVASPALEDLARDLNLELPAALRPLLLEHEIKTLADVLHIGGLSSLADAPGLADAALLARLDAHAELRVVSPDFHTNDRLIERGYKTIADIAQTPADEFVSRMHDVLGDYGASEVHVRATACSLLLDSLAIGERV